MEVPHLFVQNSAANEFNDRIHQIISSPKYIVKANGSIIGGDCEDPRDKIIGQIPIDPRKIKQLHSTLHLTLQ